MVQTNSYFGVLTGTSAAATVPTGAAPDAGRDRDTTGCQDGVPTRHPSTALRPARMVAAPRVSWSRPPPRHGAVAPPTAALASPPPSNRTPDNIAGRNFPDGTPADASSLHARRTSGTRHLRLPIERSVPSARKPIPPLDPRFALAAAGRGPLRPGPGTWGSLGILAAGFGGDHRLDLFGLLV
jgi:hypothetical protein